MRLLLCVMVATLFVACSSLKKQEGSWREIRLDANWISQIAKDENLEARKIARFKPLIYQNLVIVGGSNGDLSGFNRKSGKLQWRFSLPAGVEASGLIYKNKYLIFGAKDGYLYKIDASNGELIWKFFAKAEVLSDLSIEGDAIYFLSGANILYKINAESGKQIWVYSRVQRSRFSVRGGAQVLVLGPRIYAGFSDGFLVALQSSSGDLVWERKLASSERFGDVDNSPISNGELIFSASFDGNFYAFDKNGSLRWKADVGAYSKASVFENQLIVPSSDNKLVFMDASSGKLLKSLQIKSIASEVFIKDNLVIFNEANSNLVVYDNLKSKVIASYEPGKGSLSAPSFDSDLGQIYLNSNAGNLHALRLYFIDRRQLWGWELK
ncbi:MAG: PQQ-binding-like beta-propeller repeat protein [Bdellovibrionota bacterium]|nr:PQQ-binding-like beta-propeller repeat protein [Bdellovibrionota bacterium]